MLTLVPRGADGQLEPAMAGVIDRNGLGGHDRRMAVGHAGHEQAQADTLGGRSQRGQGRHAFEAVARALAVHRDEMIEPPHALEAQLFREPRARDDFVELQPLLSDIQAEPHTWSSVYGQPSTVRPWK